MAMRVLHDESLAKLLVYRAVLDGTVLRTREEMLGALAVLRRDPRIPPEAMETAAFPDLIRKFVDALVGQYRG